MHFYGKRYWKYCKTWWAENAKYNFKGKGMAVKLVKESIKKSKEYPSLRFEQDYA